MSQVTKQEIDGNFEEVGGQVKIIIIVEVKDEEVTMWTILQELIKPMKMTRMIQEHEAHQQRQILKEAGQVASGHLVGQGQRSFPHHQGRLSGQRRGG